MAASKTPRDLYKIKTIASLTGFNPTLLRAWERRYGLLDPTRTPTGHRLYTADDLRVLQSVRVLLDQGRTIGEVVAQGRDRLLVDSGPESPPETVPEGAFPELERLRQQVIRAAQELDDVGIQQALEQAFGCVSGRYVLERLIIPAAYEIGELWAQKKASVASEHLLTGCFLRRLQRLIYSEEPRSTRCQVICCGFPDEFHELGTCVLTYYLQLEGYRVMHLGAALPFEDLLAAIEARQPRWVLLSVTRSPVLDRHCQGLLQVVQVAPWGTRFLLGGSGVPHADPATLALLRERGVQLWEPSLPLRQLGQFLQDQEH